MLLYRGCEEACQGFRTISANSICWLALPCATRHQDKQRCASWWPKPERCGPDLLLTWGMTATVEVVGTVGKIDPQRRHHRSAGAVHDRLASAGSRYRQQSRPTGAQRRGSLYLLPAETAARGAFVHGFQTPGFIVNRAEVSSLASRDELRALGAELPGYTLVEREATAGRGWQNPTPWRCRR